MSVRELFCDVDDFLLNFASHLKATQIAAGKQPGHILSSCSVSIVMGETSHCGGEGDQLSAITPDGRQVSIKV